ncbi:MAG: oligopeptide/dipeptide ABC transporter ATP-binding protein [Bacilli bacterium]
MTKKQPLIEVRKLKKFFPLKRKSIFQRKLLNVRANEDVSFTIYKGETFGLVGESGCGKSTLGRTILQLYPPTSGSALYYGMPLHELNPAYVLNEIDKLVKYQDKADRAYKKSLHIDKKIKNVKCEIEKIDQDENQKIIDKKIAEYNLALEELNSKFKQSADSLHQSILASIDEFKAVLKQDATKYAESNWENIVLKIVKMVEEDPTDPGIQDQVELMTIPNKNVLKAYKDMSKALSLIKKHEMKKANIGVSPLQKKLRRLEEKSKDLKKEASRQLREGSRTAGQFILEKELPVISKFMREEELIAREIYKQRKLAKALSKDLDKIKSDLLKLESEVANLKINLNSVLKENNLSVDLDKDNNLKSIKSKMDSKVFREISKMHKLYSNKTAKVERFKHRVISIPKDIQNSEKKVDVLEKKIFSIQETLKSYKGKEVLPITERCQDPEYQAKMEGNREYAISLQKLTRHEMRTLRQKLQMIFQDPYSSLDPRMTVGQAISEAVVEHGLYKKGTPELEEYIIDVMAKCGLDHYMIHRYPHQFSGGQRQRIVIARALALQPEFVVCDESVSALDVSIQSQILNLLEDLKEQSDLTYLFISHDLSVIKHVSDRIGVMYLGDLVELCESEELYDNPLHPYSKSLISAIPTTTQNKRDRIILKGDIPSNIFPPSGCKFRTRCPIAKPQCAKVKPELREVAPGHQVACHYYEETKNII